MVVKGDVDGSVEAILACLDTYQSTEVKLDIVNFGVGEVAENDITMAESFDAIIYAFNTSISPERKRIAANAKAGEALPYAEFKKNNLAKLLSCFYGRVPTSGAGTRV